jgi:hypothetical protein
MFRHALLNFVTDKSRFQAKAELRHALTSLNPKLLRDRAVGVTEGRYLRLFLGGRSFSGVEDGHFCLRHHPR